MGVRTSVSIMVQAGLENSLDNLVFDRDLAEILDTLDKAASLVGDVDYAEGNVPLDKQDIDTIRFLYIEADGDLDVFLGGVAPTTAKIVGVGGTYPTGFVGAETLDLEIDGVPFTTTFNVADQSLAQVIARINSFAAFNGLNLVASNEGGQLALTSNTDGSTSQVSVVAGSAGVLAILGLVVAEVFGKDATPDADPIRLRQMADPAGSQIVTLKAYAAMSCQTSAVTVANPKDGTSVRFRVLMVGDLVDPPAC